MKASLRRISLTFLATLSIVTGWVLLANLSHESSGTSYSRTTSIDYGSWEPWVGIVLLSAGLSYYVLTYLERRKD